MATSSTPEESPSLARSFKEFGKSTREVCIDKNHWISLLKINNRGK
jgi:hypothetical protein